MSGTLPNAEPERKRSLVLLVLRLVLFLICLSAVAAIAAGFFLFLAYLHVVQPGVPGEKAPVTIPEGATGTEVGQVLKDAGVVERAWFFRLALRLDKSGKPVKHGRYVVPQGLSPMEVLHLLQEGPNRFLAPEEIPAELKITVPEGMSIAQAAGLLDEPDAFIEAASDPALIARLGVDTPTLEGFLMPNTYYFEQKPSAHDVVERMLGQFEKEYAALLDEVPEASEYDKLAVVTVASLIEEEARVADERATIAAVIYNRIDKGMPLQLDSTLQYALKKYGQRLLYEDLEADSPYNTYKHAGLPPGPVSSPGVASLRAALSPANVDYLYFVSNADGATHTFSATEAEHLKAVRRFRREIAPQRRSLIEQKSAAGD